jgi:FkbM family methyltransferase
MVASLIERARVLFDHHLTAKRLIRSAVPNGWARRLQVAATAQGIRTFDRRVVSHRFGDRDFDVVIADPVGAEWYDVDWPMPRELQLLADSRLVLGATVIEVGAHQGIVAMMLAGLVGPNGTVVAVEPNPHDYAVACENIRMNGVDNVQLVNGAGAAADGTLTFSITGRVNDDSGGSGSVVVEAVTVDTLAKRYGRPDVVFIDTEGYEGEVLKGAKETLSESPDFFVEVHAGRPLRRFGSTVDSVVMHFRRPPYKVVVGNDDHPFIPLDRADERILKHRFFLVAVSG